MNPSSRLCHSRPNVWTDELMLRGSTEWSSLCSVHGRTIFQSIINRLNLTSIFCHYRFDTVAFHCSFKFFGFVGVKSFKNRGFENDSPDKAWPKTVVLPKTMFWSDLPHKLWVPLYRGMNNAWGECEICSVTNTINMTCIIMQHDAIHTYTVSGPASATRADIPHACSCHGLRPHRRRASTHICMLVHHTYMYISLYI